MPTKVRGGTESNTMTVGADNLDMNAGAADELPRRHKRARTRPSVPLDIHTEVVDFTVLAKLLDATHDGVVVIDAGGRFAYVNPAACQLLGHPRDDLLGREYTTITSMRGSLPPSKRKARAVEPPSRALRHIVRPSGEERDLEFATVRFVAKGRTLIGGILRDVTEQRQLERKSTALATIAASLTFAETLEHTLNALARSVVQATDSRACTVVLIDDGTSEARVAGSHGLPHSYLDAVVALGLKGLAHSMEVARTRKTIVVRDSRTRMLAEAGLSVMHEYLRAADWDVVVRLPLLYQDRALGALGVYYPATAKVGQVELDFLAAISSQAAVAIEHTRLFAAAQEQAMLEERQRLARELHDSVSQTLFAASLIAEVLPQLWNHDAQEGSHRLEELRQLTRGAQAEMRMLLLELRPAVLTQVSLADLVRQLAEATTGRQRLPVTVRVDGQPWLLPPEVQVGLYRMAQEALNNVVKHAHARLAAVRITYEPEQVRLEVCDDGVGFTPSDHGAEHFGLKMMRERADMIGGRLTVQSLPGEGTRLEVTWRAR